MFIRIDRHGRLHCLYSEALDLAQLGLPYIRRASHVEPDAHGQWWADLSPVQGPRLGPFGQRSQALAAEQAWLKTHWLPQAEAPLAKDWPLGARTLCRWRVLAPVLS